MRKLLVLALFAQVVTACHRASPPTRKLSAADAGAMLVDRNWIDEMPRDADDQLHVYRFVPSMGGGVFQDRTLYQGSFELFTFRIVGDHLVFNLPHQREKVVSQFVIENVDGPAPFDLRLTLLTDPRGSHEYFGIRAETDRDGHVLEQALAVKREALEAAPR